MLSLALKFTEILCTVVLSGTEQFRGLLVQARAVADDSPVGSFAATAGVTRLSSCERADVRIYIIIQCQDYSRVALVAEHT